MLTVLRHGAHIRVANPLTGILTDMIRVTFVEEGRSGAISSMSDSTAFLDNLLGENTGLDQTRVHTHAIKRDKIEFFPIGKTIKGHINRKLFSQPQMKQQENVQSRMVDGKPTYFTTYLDDVEKADIDYRMTNETLAQVAPGEFNNTRTRTAEVQIIQDVTDENEPVPQAQLEPHGNETLTEG